MRIASSCFLRRIMLAVIVVALVYCVFQVVRSDWAGYAGNELTNYEKLMHISRLIKDSGRGVSPVEEGVPVCKIPDLEVTNAAIMRFIHDVPPLQCTPDDWVVVRDSTLVITEEARKKHGPITCVFNEILRADDYTTRLTEDVESSDIYTLRHSDFAEVKCETQTGKQWRTVMAGIRPRSKAKSVETSGIPKLNVLMFGFDSLSRNTFIRKLPKTYAFMREQLDAQVLEGYNIVGDGTPQALIPILTGKIELELPETRKRMGAKADYVNVYPMIWKEYESKGYVTGFMEDVHHIGTFTYRLKGFKEQPTDHYLRTFYLAASPLFKYSRKFCLGGIPRHKIMLDYITRFFNAYRDQPKFVFGFHGELSHDSYNDIGVADEDVYRWVKDLHDSGHLNHTIFIFMSDHGHRFAEIRNTLQGKQEERLPFFSFTFPKWFKQVHPVAYANFVYNTQRLTTPFDVHKTLQKILDFETPKIGDISQRDISLFDKIPLERSCADAFIEPHWCACLNWLELPVDNPMVVAAAQHFLQVLNDYTEEQRDICERLKIKEILWAAKLKPTKGLLDFERSGDQDGFIGEFSAKTSITSETYQVKLRTEPGDGLFEASINYDVRKDTFSTKISDVSRINMYGSQARCVENDQFHLRKYCYCKDSI